MSFNPALFRNLRGVVTSVTSHQNLSGDSIKTVEPSIGEDCNDVSPLSPTKNEHTTKDAGITPAPGATTKQLILEAARTTYFEHRELCLICRNGWSESDRCTKHAELWQLYESALVGVYGAEKVIGSISKTTPQTPDRANIQAAVPTAETKPFQWIELRDAYYNHIMQCTRCKPTGLCVEGRRLRGVFHSDFATSLQNSGA